MPEAFDIERLVSLKMAEIEEKRHTRSVKAEDANRSKQMDREPIDLDEARLHRVSDEVMRLGFHTAEFLRTKQVKPNKGREGWIKIIYYPWVVSEYSVIQRVQPNSIERDTHTELALPKERVVVASSTLDHSGTFSFAGSPAFNLLTGFPTSDAGEDQAIEAYKNRFVAMAAHLVRGESAELEMLRLTKGGKV